MNTEEGCPGRGGLGEAVAVRATSPLEPRPPRAPQDAQPAAHPPPGPALTARSRCSHAGGARWARRTQGTGPESCKLCAGLAGFRSRSAPGRSPRAAANRAPGGSSGAEGGVSGRRSPGQRAALFTAGPPSPARALPPSLPPSPSRALPPSLPPSPARALRAPDIIHSRTLACPPLLPAVTHPGPEAPAGSRGRVSSRRPAEHEKPVRLLREAILADPPLCGPRRCSEGGAWQAARGGSGPQAESAEPGRPPRTRAGIDLGKFSGCRSQ
ncbi:uncharacterized protein LOC107400846 [Peromyscus maniculatus bairdii]|uniref:uncharacterized protein LOC107400846 n=1 Tax=Peromyscus maniculatus bairdii TaxID=230844 RepID=UPI003FD4F25D